jgi:hypothetical protein
VQALELRETGRVKRVSAATASLLVILLALGGCSDDGEDKNYTECGPQNNDCDVTTQEP